MKPMPSSCLSVFNREEPTGVALVCWNQQRVISKQNFGEPPKEGQGSGVQRLGFKIPAVLVGWTERGRGRIKSVSTADPTPNLTDLERVVSTAIEP